MFIERLEQELSRNKDLRKYIREQADCKGRSYPIVMIDGDSPPTKQGRSGVRVSRVRAQDYIIPVGGYYAHSTRRVDVGSDWLLEVLMTRRYVKRVNHGKSEESKEE